MVSRVPRRAALVAVALVAIALAAVALLLVRPAVTATAATAPGVTIECAAATGLDEESCRAWGEGVVARGAPSSTFEMADLGRLRLDRGLLGLAATCRIDWFTTRYADDPVWTDEGPCPGT
jgi:hypothetical protein